METGIKHIVWLALTLVVMAGFPFASVQKEKAGMVQPGPSATKVVVKPPSTSGKTIMIQPLSAVFYQPDPSQLIRLEQVMGSKSFKAMMHDYYYQFRFAKAYLSKDQKRVSIVTTSDERFLKFRYRNNATEIIDLDKYEACGLFLFDGFQKPVLADMTNLETQAGFYFSENK